MKSGQRYDRRCAGVERSPAACNFMCTIGPSPSRPRQDLRGRGGGTAGFCSRRRFCNPSSLRALMRCRGGAGSRGDVGVVVVTNGMGRQVQCDHGLESLGGML